MATEAVPLGFDAVSDDDSGTGAADYTVQFSAAGTSPPPETKPGGPDEIGLLSSGSKKEETDEEKVC